MDSSNDLPPEIDYIGVRKPLSSYGHFFKQNLEFFKDKLVKEGSAIVHGALSKAISFAYRSMSVVEKRYYDDIAISDKERYLEEVI